jgi:phenylacetate-CoA ligase
MKLENIYLKSPVFIQQLLIQLQGFRIKRTRYNSNFRLLLNQYSKSNPYQIDSKQLYVFLKEAEKTPFWNGRFKFFNVNICAANDLRLELQKLPILSKQEVKENLDSIVNINSNENISYGHTSGTTGSGLVFPSTLSMENKQWAVWWRYRKWHGIDLNTWMGWFGGRSIANINQTSPPFWRINYPMKEVMFSAHHLNEETVRYYVDEINTRQLSWLHGYPSQLSLLAHLIKRQNLSLLPFIKIITVGAENLLVSQKMIIEEIFKAQVREHYGLAEGVGNISEHPDGSLIPDQDFCWMEFIQVDSENPSLCKIIGTNYNNTAFPLIRYDTGDRAQIIWQPDGSPKILSIDGRREDFITLPNGVKLGRLDHIFKDLTEVQEAQIYQLDVNNIVLRIVKGINYDKKKQEELLIRETKKRLGNYINISIEYIDHIPRTKSGKLRFVISDVK